MIKSMLRLNNDVRAKAGEFLVLHENGNVYVVDEGALSSLLGVEEETVNTLATFSKEKTENRKRKATKLEEADDMLLRGRSVNEVSFQLGLSRKIVGMRRATMVEEGLIPPLTKKTPVKHHWFKSAEALEAARARAYRMMEIRMEKRAMREAGK